MKNKKLISLLKRFPADAEVCITKQSNPVDGLVYAETNAEEEFIILSTVSKNFLDISKKSLDKE